MSLKFFFFWQLSLFFVSFCFLGACSYDVFAGDEADPRAIHEIFNDIEDDTSLPDKDIPKLIAEIVRETILPLFALLLTGMILWSGALFTVHFGEEDKLNQAKKILIWSLIGVIVTAVSYALVAGITRLDWSQ
jgi:hypothetical protein